MNDLGKTLQAFLILCIVMSSGFYIGFQYKKQTLHQQYTKNLDEYFRIKYSNISETEGNIIIDDIVSNASTKKSDYEKLDTIAELITDNFTNPY